MPRHRRLGRHTSIEATFYRNGIGQATLCDRKQPDPGFPPIGATLPAVPAAIAVEYRDNVVAFADPLDIVVKDRIGAIHGNRKPDLRLRSAVAIGVDASGTGYLDRVLSQDRHGRRP